MKTELVDSYVVFDTETTGLNSETDCIIEIGAIKVIDNEIVETIDILIHPGVEIPEIITSITGITMEMVANERSIEDVLPEFIEFVGDFPIVCHNTDFDFGFINASLKKVNLPVLKNQAIDTVVLAKEYIPKAYNYKLQTLKNYFKLDFGSHRSVDDCQTTNYIYQECKKRASQTN